MRVLYVNHTATIGGGERSLLELLRALPGELSPAVACPDGEFASAVEQVGVPVTTIAEAAPSFRIDPVHTTRDLTHLGRAAVAVWLAARRLQVDLVHANSVRAGLIAAPLGRFGAPPVVVHVRDCLPAGAIASLTRRAIRTGAALVLANSSYSAASFAPNGSVPSVRVVHNSVDLTRFDPSRIDRAEARFRLGLEPHVPALGVIAQITPWKAQDDAIRVLAALRRHGSASQLLIVGEAKFTRGSETFDNRTFERSLHWLAREFGLDGAVSFLGERADMPEIFHALDLVLVPSWQEPFGRSVIEAMAMETPVVATTVGGPAEIVTDGVEGLLLPPRRPERWAEAIARLLESPDELRRMGEAGRRTAVARFGREAHVQAVLAAYREVLVGGRV